MKAMKVSRLEQGPLLIEANIPQPKPGPDEILIRVCAAGVTPTELTWYPTANNKDGTPRIGAVPGHEFSAVIVEAGPEVRGFSPGDAVYGMNDWFADGATAEFCLAPASSISPKPVSLTHEAAATVPISALTAWQGLFERAKLQPGERVLIQGGAGSVGLFAVQLAHHHGAKVIATASSANLKLVADLGAEEVIDYKAARFDDYAHTVDVVFDTVGGETLERSWNLLNSNGRLVTIAADGEGNAEHRAKEAFFIVEPSQSQLGEVAKRLDQGALKTFVRASVPFEKAAIAYGGAVPGGLTYGKVVIGIAE
jgi:NADPH:quinone reductase-like Zn-dependent oxidoreductase